MYTNCPHDPIYAPLTAGLCESPSLRSESVWDLLINCAVRVWSLAGRRSRRPDWRAFQRNIENSSHQRCFSTCPSWPQHPWISSTSPSFGLNHHCSCHKPLGYLTLPKSAGISTTLRRPSRFTRNTAPQTESYNVDVRSNGLYRSQRNHYLGRRFTQSNLLPSFRIHQSILSVCVN